MKELKYLSFFNNNDLNETIILNRTNGSSMKINSEIFQVISSACSLEDVRRIGNEYDEEDKAFFDNIAETMSKCRMLDDNYESKKTNNVSYIITDLCNLNCAHCSFSAKHISDVERCHIEVNLNVLSKIIALSPGEISVTGGEPLLATNFDKLMEMLNDKFSGKTVLCTNAILINEKNADSLCRCFDGFDISLDGYDELSSDAIRGIGVFKKVLKSIEILKKHNAKAIKLSCAIKGSDEKARTSFTELCSKLKVEPVIRRMSLSGRAAENKLDDALDMSCFLAPTILSCSDCAGGKSMLTVDWNGDIYPCNNFTKKEYRMGNITDDKISEKLGWNENSVWFRNFSQYLPDKREECKDCEVNLFCWNCPSVIKAFLESRNISSLKSICATKKKAIL